jgi:bifunctional UDP-N-acetylglucosamine pyrophosphorylase/glucosamine-1-phosphate N-acetyltransferase
MSKVAFIVLAAGKGTRFKSKTPKVLQKIAGLELVSHLLNTVNSPNSYLKNKKDIFVVVSHEKDKIISHIGNEVSFINQEHLNGTASAVSSCLGELHKYDKAIILYGDVPFIEIKTINNLLEGLDKNNLMLLTAVFDSPDGYGRIVRDKKNKSIKRIVEHKDANLDELLIQEVNSGILACNTKFLSEQLPNIKNNNAQKEYYLTDLVELAKSNDYKIGSICIKDVWEVYGINDAFHLGTAERYYQEKKAKNLMKSGVRIYDFKRLDIRGNLTCEQDVEIDINCIFIGEVFLASGVKVGANSVLIDCNIEKNTTILPMSHI